ncbi:MAG: sirohydrochlorin cobaltochelatase [Firmicutes bacterium]|nr:sirohydrochlorin cobaltochelatase [Bacillota bacterium]
MKKKFLSFVLAAAMVFTVSVPTLAFAGTDTDAVSTATPAPVISETKASDIVSGLGMFSPAEGSTSIEIDKYQGTAKITFTTTPQKVKTTKFALVSQDATTAKKEKAAVSAVVTPAGEKFVSTFTFEIPVSKLGTAMPYSVYWEGASDPANDGWHNFSDASKAVLTVKYTPALVSALTSAIYYQERTEGTDALCEAAGKAWAALTEEEQKQVEGFGYYKDEEEEKGGYEYFAEDTGDASKDNARNADKIGDYELLVASFGTSYNDNRIASIGALEKALEKASSSFSVRRAFTSQIIINHIQARDGIKIDNMDQALERAIKNKVQVVVVQPTTLMAGAEYDEIVESVKKYESKFKQIIVAKPICSNSADTKTVSEALYADTAKEAGMSVEEAKANKETAFVYMGHGTHHDAKVLYEEIQKIYDDNGYANAFVGTVDGAPESTTLENVIAAVKAAGFKKVILRPYMIVAGDHANNDMAEEWGEAFEAAGFEQTSQIIGLGELKAVQDVAVKNAKAAIGKAAVAKSTTATVKSAKKAFTVKITAKSGMSGYEYRYATSKSKLTTAKVRSAKAGKTFTVKNLSSKKTYYVQVRTYKKTPSGKKVYSKWSTAKKVTTK